MNREQAIDHLLRLTQDFVMATDPGDDERVQSAFGRTYDALRGLGVTEGELPPNARQEDDR